MALRLGNKLGIEFHQDELRIFEVKYSGNDISFGCVGSVPMDPEYIKGGIVINPDNVGERLRIFLDRQHITTNDAVASFPTDNCIARVLNLPRAPESEVRALVNGEVEHFGLVKAGGVYDHFKLNAPTKEGIGLSVLFMATDGTVMTSIDRSLQSAGLRLIALEPTHVALLRSAHYLATRTENALFLTVSEYRSDVSLMCDGKVVFYRSFEVGANEMVNIQSADSMFPEADDAMSVAARYLNLEAASTLAIEIRRSIDYFSRELPEAPRLTRIIVTSNASAMEPIGDWLQEVTGLETEFVRLTGATADSGNLSFEDGVRFLTSYGLAIRDNPAISKDLPRLDLSLHEQMGSALEQSDRKLRISAYLCAGLCAAALVGTGLGYFRAKNAAANMQVADKDLRMMQDLEKRRLTERQTKQDRLTMLQTEGIPLNRIVLAIGRSVPPQAGLSNLRLSLGSVELAGEAKAEESLVQMTRALQENTFVSNVSLTSFERQFDADGSKGIKFQMSVSTIAPPPPSLISPDKSDTDVVR